MMRSDVGLTDILFGIREIAFRDIFSRSDMELCRNNL